MTAQIYKIRDYQSKRALERAYAELEKHMAEVAKLPHYHDTAPSEIIPTDTGDCA